VAVNEGTGVIVGQEVGMTISVASIVGAGVAVKFSGVAEVVGLGRRSMVGDKATVAVGTGSALLVAARMFAQALSTSKIISK
jgi:hypothetical protein